MRSQGFAAARQLTPQGVHFAPAATNGPPTTTEAAQGRPFPVLPVRSYRVNKQSHSMAENAAVALTMFDLGMLLPVTGVPKLPQPIPGREEECDLAMSPVRLVEFDDELRAYVRALDDRSTWHPEDPVGISAHKLANGGWIIAVVEVRAALTAYDKAEPKAVEDALQGRFTDQGIDTRVWEDWVRLLRHSAEHGEPLRTSGLLGLEDHFLSTMPVQEQEWRLV